MLDLSMDPHEVILAVASPPGRSLRGIIRISGRRAFDLAKEVITLQEAASDERSFVKRHNQSAKLEEDGGAFLNSAILPRGHYRARLELPKSLSLGVHAFVFPAPHSYTGENSIEMQLPGNPHLLERVIDHMLDLAGERAIPARRAEAGEFTARAFFGGRLTLTQAEGVAATIAAQSDAELRAAHFLTSGTLGQFARALADELGTALALVEAGIDFTDQEDVVAISPDDLLHRLSGLHRRVNDHLKHAVGSEQLQAIPWVVLRGSPNAGKSALFNALLGHERAVVSPTAGTTRDVLAEPLTIQTGHGLGEVMLIDLAGVDDDDASAINLLMQQAAGDALSRAELVLRCVPVDVQVDELEPGDVLVRTKSDLVAGGLRSQSPNRQIQVSAVTGHGMNEVRRAIAERLADRVVSLAADATALRPRHEASLRSAMHNLADAMALVDPLVKSNAANFPNPELIAAAMRAALNDLGSLAGDMTADDVLGRIFSSFCVGK